MKYDNGATRTRRMPGRFSRQEFLGLGAAGTAGLVDNLENSNGS